MRATNWNDLPTIDAVQPLDASDHECLDEIGAVLRRRGKTRRFGAALLHQHFELGPGELLVEHCDLERRTLTTAPKQESRLILERYLPTVWRFDGVRAQACSYCPMYGNKHAGYKEQH